MTVEQLAEQRAAIAEAFSAPGRHRATSATGWPDTDTDSTPTPPTRIEGDVL